VPTGSAPANHKREFASCLRGLLAQAVFLIQLTVPQRVFKALNLGTHLGDAAARMSHTKVAPDEFKPHECERNAGRSKPPIPYIPKKDVIQEAVDSITNMLKLTSSWTPEQFLVHIQQALDAIRQIGLQTALEKAIKGQGEV